jgi:glycosyltransferase involved in cell wall biosynthesis
MNSVISIIIPCYNDADFIEQAINSALNQTYNNKEIIVVDDGSDEKTKAVLKSIEPKIDFLIVQDNQGQSSARNNGIKAARGEYIIVLDSDDYFEPTFAEKAIKIISKRNEVKIVTCWGRRITENEILIDIFKPGGGRLNSFLLQNGSFGSCMFRKSDWERVGGYDESMKQGFEDWEFYIRLLSSGGIAYVIPEVLFNYRSRKNSTTARANKIKYDLRRYILDKHQNLYQKHHLILAQYLLNLLEREEFEKLKNLRRIEFRIGLKLLRPLRWIKRQL